MTRDEAIQKISRWWLTGESDALVDSLTVLGLLKLDELPEHEAVTCLRHRGFDGSANMIVQILTECGFKITKDGSSK